MGLCLPSLQVRLLGVVVLGLIAGVAGASRAEGVESGKAAAAEQTPSEAKVLRLYTARHYAADVALYEAFEKQTGIRIESVHIKNTAQLVERTLAERNNPQADMVITSDVGQMVALAEKRALAPLGSPSIVALVPRELRDEVSDLWTVFALRARVLAYQKSKVTAAELATIENLSNPRWKGRILVRSSGHVYNQSMAAHLLALHGEASLRQWASGVTRNLARKPQGGDTDQIKAIASGEGDVAIVNSYYVGRMLGSEDPQEKALMAGIGLVYPNQEGRGAHVNGSAVGIIKASPRQAQAKLFAEFLLSKQAQQTLTLVSKEFPVRRDVAADPALGDLKQIRLDYAGLKSIYPNTARAMGVLDEVGWR